MNFGRFDRLYSIKADGIKAQRAEAEDLSNPPGT